MIFFVKKYYVALKLIFHKSGGKKKLFLLFFLILVLKYPPTEIVLDTPLVTGGVLSSICLHIRYVILIN